MLELLLTLFALVNGDDLHFHELEFLSAYYGMNDCMSVEDATDWPALADNQCVVIEDQHGVKSTRSADYIMMGLRCGEPNWAQRDLDLMPCHFNYGIIGDLSTDMFLVTMSDGSQMNPACLYFDPADEDDERQSPVIMGNWGDGQAETVKPVKVEIVNDMFFNVNGIVVNGKGLTYEHDMSYSNPEYIVEAYLQSISDAIKADSEVNGCTAPQFNHMDTEVVVKVAWSGGTTRDGITTFDTDSPMFELLDADGNVLSTGVLGTADIGDLDNVMDICLGSDFDIDALVSVRATCQTGPTLPDGTIDIYDISHTAVVAPKGALYPCVPHEFPIDKQMVTDTWHNTCKCDFALHPDAYCDPNGLIDGATACPVADDGAGCDDLFTNDDGVLMSNQACSFDELYNPNGTPLVWTPVADDTVTTTANTCNPMQLAIMAQCNSYDEVQAPCESDPNCNWNDDVCMSMGGTDFQCMPIMDCSLQQMGMTIMFQGDGSCAVIPGVTDVCVEPAGTLADQVTMMSMMLPPTVQAQITTALGAATDQACPALSMAVASMGMSCATPLVGLAAVVPPLANAPAGATLADLCPCSCAAPAAPVCTEPEGPAAATLPADACPNLVPTAQAFGIPCAAPLSMLAMVNPALATVPASVTIESTCPCTCGDLSATQVKVAKSLEAQEVIGNESNYGLMLHVLAVIGILATCHAGFNGVKKFTSSDYTPVQEAEV